jgi:hypothetical protein
MESDRQWWIGLLCSIEPTFAEQVKAAASDLANTQKAFEDFQTSTFATGTLGHCDHC